jgi:predicted small lipoprotein YifL
MKRVLALVTVIALTACGQVAPLRPQAGASLPPKPAAAPRAPDAEALMTPSDQSRPKRNDELLQSSEKRSPDKFDLPPSG